MSCAINQRPFSFTQRTRYLPESTAGAPGVVSGAGVAWQPSRAARNAGTHEMGRMRSSAGGGRRQYRPRRAVASGYLTYQGTSFRLAYRPCYGATHETDGPDGGSGHLLAVRGCGGRPAGGSRVQDVESTSGTPLSPGPRR